MNLFKQKYLKLTVNTCFYVIFNIRCFVFIVYGLLALSLSHYRPVLCAMFHRSYISRIFLIHLACHEKNHNKPAMD